MRDVFLNERRSESGFTSRRKEVFILSIKFKIMMNIIRRKTNDSALFIERKREYNTAHTL